MYCSLLEVVCRNGMASISSYADDKESSEDAVLHPLSVNAGWMAVEVEEEPDEVVDGLLGLFVFSKMTRENMHGQK